MRTLLRCIAVIVSFTLGVAVFAQDVPNSCLSTEEFLNSEIDLSLDQVVCSPELVLATQFCKSTPLTVEEKYKLLAIGNLTSFTPIFLYQSSDSMKLTAIEVIRVHNLISYSESEQPDKSEFLLYLYSFLFFEVLMDATENSPGLSDMITVFGYQRELRQIYSGGIPRGSYDIQRHIQCVVQCDIHGISFGQIVNSVPFNECIESNQL